MLKKRKKAKNPEYPLKTKVFRDIIFMYIAGTSKSPITLLELGEFLTSGKLIVVCEEDFYRYGNVRIMCERFGVPLYNDYEDGLKKLTLELKYITHIYEDF